MSISTRVKTGLAVWGRKGLAVWGRKVLTVEENRINNEIFVYVFQMGKVASTSIVKAIGKRGIEVYQPHFLTENAFHSLLKQYNNPDLLPFFGANLLGQFSENIVLYNRLLRQKKYRKKDCNDRPVLKVITLSRDPMAWYLSNLSQNYDEYETDIRAWADASGATGNKEVSAQNDAHLVRQFLQTLFMFFDCHMDRVDFSERHRLGRLLKTDHEDYEPGDEILAKHSLILMRPHFWFEEHFDPALDSKLLSNEFDIDRGYAIYRQCWRDVLVLRFEDLRKNGEEVIGEFLGLKKFSLGRINVSEKKDKGQLIKRAVAQVDFPSSFLDKIYQSPYCAKYYSADMTDAFRQRLAK